MTPALSRRVTSVPPSPTLGVSARAAAMRREGVDVVPFALGEPDFDTPEVIKRAALDALAANQTHYMPTLGDQETRRALAEKLTRENGIAGLGPEHVAISAGAKHSIFNVLHALIDPPAPGEDPAEVILPVPAWVSYDPIARLAGARVVELDTTAAGDFKVTPDQLRRAITPRARVLMLNSPSNPCGTMYSEGELRALAAVVARAAESVAPGLVVVSDEIYEKIVYGGIAHFSIGSVPEIASRTVTINGMSKAYAMTGWRAGYAACPGEFGRRLVDAVDTLQGQSTSCITSFVYPAIRAALSRAGGETERMCASFAKRARLIADHLARIPGLSAPTPTGAFYLFPDVSACFGRTTEGGRRLRGSVDFADALLEEAHVATVPGEAFGGIGRHHIRISFACAEPVIEEGMRRLARFVAALR